MWQHASPGGSAAAICLRPAAACHRQPPESCNSSTRSGQVAVGVLWTKSGHRMRRRTAGCLAEWTPQALAEGRQAGRQAGGGGSASLGWAARLAVLDDMP